MPLPSRNATSVTAERTEWFLTSWISRSHQGSTELSFTGPTGNTGVLSFDSLLGEAMIVGIKEAKGIEAHLQQQSLICWKWRNRKECVWNKRTGEQRTERVLRERGEARRGEWPRE